MTAFFQQMKLLVKVKKNMFYDDSGVFYQCFWQFVLKIDDTSVNFGDLE